MKAKFIKPTPTEEGITLTLKITNEELTKAIEHEFVDMRGEYVDITLPKATEAPDANFLAWQKAQLEREIAIRRDMLDRIEPYSPETPLFEETE